MKRILKAIMTPPWMARVFQPELPLTEDNVRPFIHMMWNFFGLDNSDPGKEALIKFCLECGEGRLKYNFKTIEPLTWAFINGFDRGFVSGYEKHVKAFEEAAVINNRVIAENQSIIEHTRAECDRIMMEANRILTETMSRYETIKAAQIIQTEGK